MYQGKYQAPKGTEKPKRVAATRRIEDVPFASEEKAQTPKPAAATAVREAAGTLPTETPQENKPRRRTSSQTRSPKKKANRRPTKGTIVFYSIYGLVIVAFFVLMTGALSALDSFLVDYEASQPKYKCQEVFDQYFSDPDWGALYDLADLEDTLYEGREEYVRYMTETVGDQQLRYVATASGDPDRVCKYIIKAGEEILGTFTLVTDEHKLYDITRWELGQIDLRSPSREQDVTVIVGSGQTAYVNGVALGDAHIVRTTVTLAEEYLPEGVHGHSSTTYYLDDLLAQPQVEVKDADGNPVETTYDASTGVYTAQFHKDTAKISQEEESLVIAAAKVLSEFRIEAKSATALARYFDANSDYYKATVKQDTWMQNYRDYQFTEPVVSDYYRYSDTLFSAHIEMSLKVTRNNGTVKDYDASGTFFFTKRSDGQWLVTDTTRVKVQQEVNKVRLVYMLDGQEVAHELVYSTTVQLEPPYVTVPEGKVFAGWFRETVDENGEPVLALAFKPDESTGLVYLGTGVTLEPMVLHARFEDKGAE